MFVHFKQNLFQNSRLIWLLVYLLTSYFHIFAMTECIEQQYCIKFCMFLGSYPYTEVSYLVIIILKKSGSFWQLKTCLQYQNFCLFKSNFQTNCVTILCISKSLLKTVCTKLIMTSKSLAIYRNVKQRSAMIIPTTWPILQHQFVAVSWWSFTSKFTFNGEFSTFETIKSLLNIGDTDRTIFKYLFQFSIVLVWDSSSVAQHLMQYRCSICSTIVKKMKKRSWQV